MPRDRHAGRRYQVGLLVAAVVLSFSMVGGIASVSTAAGPAPRSTVPQVDAGPGGGYWLVGSDGGIYAYGDAPFYGSTGSLTLNKPIVGMAATADGGGYWLVGSDGGIFSFGDAPFYGSTGSLVLNKPIVGMVAAPDGHGYWLVGSDGGIFTFGDAVFYGSTGSLTLNKPIVGMVATPDGHGYWLVGSDGGIYAYGDAPFYGSTGSLTLNKPIVGMAATADGGGYWLVASDGGIFAFGDATFYGSTGGLTLNKPVVGMAPTLDGHGYWLVAADGGIFSYGDAVFYGSPGGTTVNAPIVGMAVVRSHSTKVTADELTDVSCPTTTFCAAVDTGGNVVTYAGGRWAAPINVVPASTGGFTSVSCPTATFCMAVSGSDRAYSLYDGSSWSPPAQPPAAADIPSDFVSVSCPTTTFCATVDGTSGTVAIYYPTYPVAADRWMEPYGDDGDLGPLAGPRSLSCSVSTFTVTCLVVNGSGSYQVVHTDQPMTAAQFVPVDGNASVSCTSPSFCAVVGAHSGTVAVYNGSSFAVTSSVLSPWSYPTGLTGVSCAGTSCTAIDGSNVYSSTGGLTWTAGVPFDPAHDAVALSCPSSTFCAVVASSGGAYVLDPSSP